MSTNAVSYRCGHRAGWASYCKGGRRDAKECQDLVERLGWYDGWDAASKTYSSMPEGWNGEPSSIPYVARQLPKWLAEEVK